MPWSSKGSVDSNKYNSFQAHWLAINSRKVNSSNGILPLMMMNEALRRSYVCSNITNAINFDFTESAKDN